MSESHKANLDHLREVFVSKTKSRRQRFYSERFQSGSDEDCSLPYIELEVSLSRDRRGLRAKIKIWADRWCYIAAWRDFENLPRWMEESQGRLSGELMGSKIYSMFLDYAENLASRQIGTAQDSPFTLWGTVLKSGPRELAG